MSKRNFILLIIILVALGITFFGFLYFRRPAVQIEDTGGTNFISQFNPFGNNNPASPLAKSPEDTTDYQPNQTGEIPKIKLIKISSMPIAGFTVFTKERLKEVPVPVTTPITTDGVPYNFGFVTLKSGSQGESVKEIQRFLNNTLSLSLELDGILNTVVVDAIKQWQSSNKLVADGTVGPKTKLAMYASVNQEIKTAKPTPPPTEFAVTTRYVAKTNGNIYQTFADKIEERKFSITIIPRVYDAYFGNNGESVAMRYLKANQNTIETFVGTLPKELLGGDTTGNNEIKGSFLPNDVKDISVSPDGSRIFYLFNSGDEMIGTTLNLLTNKKIQIFDSPFTEWLSWWPNSNMITLSTKPSVGIPGYVYKIDSTGKNMSQVFGGVAGLTTLGSPDGKSILYSDDKLLLSIYQTDTRNSEVLGIKTLPEKCVWGKSGDALYCSVPKSIGTAPYPDSWYQGEVSFDDQLWKIDVKTGNGTLLLNLATATEGEEIDGIKLSLDENENYLFFVNKKDSFLWRLDLK